jgi:uncharacterized protein YjiS (DUF1127 family)
MREYVLHQAQLYEAASGSGLLSRVLRHWRARRAVARLDGLSDRMLEDIGVTRYEVRWAANLPLSCNAALELHETARLRRAGTRCF